MKQSHAIPALAPKTLEKHPTRWHRLYEQQKRKAAPESAAVLNAYVLRWRRQCKAGLGGLLDAFIGEEAATALRPTQDATGQPYQRQG